MDKKRIVKVSVDFFMTVFLLLLMCFQLTGQLAHEYVGVAMFLLWIVHHFLNRHWFGAVFKGKYTLYKAAQVFVNILLFVCMILLIISGISLSRYVFDGLNVGISPSIARRIHLAASNWGLVLMSVHIGMHWNKMAAFCVGRFKHESIVKVTALAVALYGVYCFFSFHMADNLFLLSEFAYFDDKQSAVRVFTGYISVMAMFVFFTHIVVRFILRKVKPSKADI